MPKESVQNVVENIPEAKQDRVQDVIDYSTGRRKLEDKQLLERIKPTLKDSGKRIQKKDASGSITGKRKRGNLSQSSYGNLESHKKGSKLRWKQPKTVRQFASQVNAVATKVLNGEIDMDEARVYASLTRVLAQAASIEVTRARFLKKAPDLTIDDEMFEGSDER